MLQNFRKHQLQKHKLKGVSLPNLHNMTLVKVKSIFSLACYYFPGSSVSQHRQSYGSNMWEQALFGIQSSSEMECIYCKWWDYGMLSVTAKIRKHTILGKACADWSCCFVDHRETLFLAGVSYQCEDTVQYSSFSNMDVSLEVGHCSNRDHLIYQT